MKRRDFLKSAAIVPAAIQATATLGTLGTLGHATTAHAAEPWANGSEWKLYAVTTRVEVATADGPARAWIPLPSALSDYARPLGNDWTGNVATHRVHDAHYGSTAILYAQWAHTERPYVEVTSRFLTRDRAVDLSRPRRFDAQSTADLAEYLKATELLPTDGIVKATAQKAVGTAKSDVAKARAIYDWIVDNTLRDPKTRGCGQGDIRAMLETGNLGGKCADLNALFVGMARSASSCIRKSRRPARARIPTTPTTSSTPSRARLPEDGPRSRQGRASQRAEMPGRCGTVAAASGRAGIRRDGFGEVRAVDRRPAAAAAAERQQRQGIQPRQLPRPGGVG